MSVIKSIDYFTLDGTNSNDMGLYLNTPPVPPMAKRDTESFVPWNGSETIVRKKESYADVTVELNCLMFKEPTQTELNSLHAWLSKGGELKTSRYSGFFYKVKSLDSVTVNQKHSEPVKSGSIATISVKIKFKCSSFRYTASARTLTFSENTYANFDATGVVVQPVITITDATFKKSEDITQGNRIQVAGERNFWFDTYSNICTKVTIDCKRRITYNQGNVLLKTLGEYPWFSAAETTKFSVNFPCSSKFTEWKCYL